jgi:Bax protein
MKKKLTYREKLLGLAKIYNVKEIQEYIKRRKNLTSGQLELILRKNKIIIPKDFQTNFYRENIAKPINDASKDIETLKNSIFKSIDRVFKKIKDLKENTLSATLNFFINLWNSIGKAGLAFLNFIPIFGQTYSNFLGTLLTDLFNGIYNQKINKARANHAILGFFIIVGLITIITAGVTTFNNPNKLNENNLVKKEQKIKKPKTAVKKPDVIIKKEVKKSVAKKEKKTVITDAILPDLNLKTQTVLNLFKDVNYDLNTVRDKKTVKPIYFTQFPKDLDEIENIQLKKETFIKIVLPLIVAENEKILDDRLKLKKISSRKITTDEEKTWLRQKFLEYKVKKGSMSDLRNRMDIIPASIALAQAAKESGWGTSRFALEGNAIFGQWTWSGQGIEPLLRDKTKKHKILRFPILRASVKSYKNNLNTHKSYVKFREKRSEMRQKNKKINGLELTETLKNYEETGSEYTKILEQIIKQNQLMDFEPVRLASSEKKIELDL